MSIVKTERAVTGQQRKVYRDPVLSFQLGLDGPTLNRHPPDPTKDDMSAANSRKERKRKAKHTKRNAKKAGS